MPDNKKLTRPHDAKRIDIHDPDEVRNWCKLLGCTAQELKAAVKAVGTSAATVAGDLMIGRPAKLPRVRLPAKDPN